MTAPLIAIPTYHLGAGQVGTWDGAYALPKSYVAALVQAGARTALLPPAQPVAADEVLASFDGLLLAGGGDIEPARYGAAAHPALYGTDPDRDELELELARAAVRLGLPTLGICRGVQLLNVAFGGTLVQHVPDLGGPVEHRDQAKQAMHGLRVEPGSRLAAALGRVEAEGLSHHHQALDRLGRASGRWPGRRTGWSRGSSGRRAGRWGCCGTPRAPPTPTRPSTGCCARSSPSRPAQLAPDFGAATRSR